jgi:hypothetical protein
MNFTSGNFTDCRIAQPLPADGAAIYLNASNSVDPGSNTAQFCTFIRLIGRTGVHGYDRELVTWRFCNFIEHHGFAMIYQRLGAVIVENCILMNCTDDQGGNSAIASTQATITLRNCALDYDPTGLARLTATGNVYKTHTATLALSHLQTAACPGASTAHPFSVLSKASLPGSVPRTGAPIGTTPSSVPDNAGGITASASPQGPNRLGLILGIVGGAVVLALMICIACVYVRRKKKNPDYDSVATTSTTNSTGNQQALV